MGRQELAPVLSRVGSALQFRRDRLTSPLSIKPSKLCNSSSLRATLQPRYKRFGMLNVAGLSKGQNCASHRLAHYDTKRYCNVTRDPQVAYLSRRNHFHVKNGQNGCGKRSFLMFQAIIAHEMTGFPWKCFTVSFPW